MAWRGSRSHFTGGKAGVLSGGTIAYRTPERAAFK